MIAPTLGGILVARLLFQNRVRLKTVLRVTRGHIIAALALAILSPVGAVGGIPVSAIYVIFDPGITTVHGTIHLFDELSPVQRAVAGALWIVVYSLIWYFPASLVVSGIASKWRRFLVFALFLLGIGAAFHVLYLIGSRGDVYLFPGFGW